METATGHNEALRQSGKEKRLVECIGAVNQLFVLTVVAATAIAVVYFALRGSDVVISGSCLLASRPAPQFLSSSVGVLPKSTELFHVPDRAHPVRDFTSSNVALAESHSRQFLLRAYNASRDVQAHLVATRVAIFSPVSRSNPHLDALKTNIISRHRQIVSAGREMTGDQHSLSEKAIADETPTPDPQSTQNTLTSSAPLQLS